MIRIFWEYVKEDFIGGRKFLVLLFLAVLIVLNYHWDWEDSIMVVYRNSWKGVGGFFLLYFGFYLFALLILQKWKAIQNNNTFWFFVLPTFFMLSVYQSCNVLELLGIEPENDYFHLKLFNRYDSLFIYGLMMLILGLFIGKGKYKNYGLFQFRFNARIYFYFLMAMVPLLIWAATQEDFLNQYPNLKLKYFDKEDYLSYFLKFEPFYLLDFVGVEWFFRGFLILAFSQFIHKETVFAAACIYCMFHFGKPLMECISSFFGGYILGYMSYKSKTIWGGIIVHMGIALLMDIFAIISIFAL